MLQLYSHFLEFFPAEACALELNNGQYILLDNKSSDPVNHFYIDPRDLLPYLGKIKYLCHTHTKKHYPGTIIDPRAPSSTDLQTHFRFALPGKIYHVDGENVSKPIIFNDEKRIRPLVGRQFVHNATDCWELVRDALRLMRYEKWTIQTALDHKSVINAKFACFISNVVRSPNWFAEGDPLFERSWKSLGFVEVPIEDLTFGDALLMQIYSPDRISHIGLYVGYNQILHHMPGQLSRVDKYQIYHSRVKKVIRL